MIRVACLLIAAAALSACAILPADLPRVGASSSETGAAGAQTPTGRLPSDPPAANGDKSAAISFTLVPDQTARASWSAPPR